MRGKDAYARLRSRLARRFANERSPFRPLNLSVLLIPLLTLLGANTALAGPEDDALLNRWLARQTNVTAWSADFVQTRHLKALTQPLTTPGRVWFVAPDQFRWELGTPAQSIALRAKDDLLVIAPRLKRAERYSLADFASGPMKDALALLDTGFPRDAADFHRRFDLLGLARTNDTYAFRLQPRAAAARKLLPELTIVIGTNDFRLSATELVFTDGSRLRNDFTNATENPVIDPARFKPPMDATWKVTEPLKPK